MYGVDRGDHSIALVQEYILEGFSVLKRTVTDYLVIPVVVDG